MENGIALRFARLCDVLAIEELINGYAGERLTLPRTAESIERSENIEVATLVRTADACGHQICTNLRPLRPKKRLLAAVLNGFDA